MQTPSKLRLTNFIIQQLTQGMMVPGREDICKPERPACNLSAMELSASALGVGAA